MGNRWTCWIEATHYAHDLTDNKEIGTCRTRCLHLEPSNWVWVRLAVADFIPKRQPSTRPVQSPSYFWMWSMKSVHDHSKKIRAPPAMILRMNEETKHLIPSLTTSLEDLDDDCSSGQIRMRMWGSPRSFEPSAQINKGLY